MYQSKKFFTIILFSLLCTLVFSNSVSAKEMTSNSIQNSTETWTLSKDVNGDAFIVNTETGEKILKAWGYNSIGELIQLNLNDYVQELNCTPIITEDEINSTNKTIESKVNRTFNSLTYVFDCVRFKREKTYVINGSRTKVTPSVKGASTITYGESVTTTESFSAGFNLTSEMKSSIKAGATFGWNKSSSSSTSFGMSFKVPKNKTGYITFTPKLNAVYGELVKTKVSTTGGSFPESHIGYATGYSPVKLSTGFSDGTFELVTY